MRTMINGFNNPNNYDFKFKIIWATDEPNTSDNIIYCHKWIVEQNSDYLKQLLADRQAVNETEIKGYSYKTFYNFIQYLYTDSIESIENDVKVLSEILLLSDMYSEEELKTRCVSAIKPLMNVENFSNIYSSAINNKSYDLEKYCFEFMSRNIKSIVKTKGYEQMDPKIAKSFLTKCVEKQKLTKTYCIFQNKFFRLVNFTIILLLLVNYNYMAKPRGGELPDNPLESKNQTLPSLELKHITPNPKPMTAPSKPMTLSPKPMPEPPKPNTPNPMTPPPKPATVGYLHVVFFVVISVFLRIIIKFFKVTSRIRRIFRRI